MEKEEEVSEATNSEEEVAQEDEQEDELLEDVEEEDVEEIKQKLAEAEEAKRQLTARAKKAEAEAKEARAPKAEKSASSDKNIKNTLSEESVDVKILESQGVDEEAINYLKKLAKVNGTSLLAAQQDELYVSFKEKKDAKQKSERASLGASRGSGQARGKKNLNSEGLSPDEHKELWKQKTQTG